MVEDSETKILAALTELKNQLQNVRGIITQTGNEEEIWQEKNQERNQEKSDNYTVNITPDELTALLSLSPTEAAADFTAETSNADELIEIKTAFLKFQEQTASEIKNLQQSITILSEMWGLHEMEIRKAGNEKI